MLDRTIAGLQKSGERPSLLLHVCCAPCSSYVLEYISAYFDITAYFYNPNISPESEFVFRLSELSRFLEESGHREIGIISPEYDPREFYGIVSGMEELPEGGERCRKCYELRLRRTAEAAKTGGFDYFTTTLSISPYKNSAWLNEIGGGLAEEYGVSYLFSDFKKHGGYKRSIELSHEYGLYRQDYCGCVYSKLERDKRTAAENEKQ